MKSAEAMYVDEMISEIQKSENDGEIIFGCTAAIIMLCLLGMGYLLFVGLFTLSTDSVSAQQSVVSEATSAITVNIDVDVN